MGYYENIAVCKTERELLELWKTKTPVTRNGSITQILFQTAGHWSLIITIRQLLSCSAQLLCSNKHLPAGTAVPKRNLREK